ncbi:cytochrome b/b6 domain-containing protein [Streptomyces sp. SID9913]|uniref:Cytochrome b/b6 domain-containing protein n=3 Tax=unclassified Streptomyces TaxID=2593676 RepID=A0A6G3QQP3_9ACTN|nr:MULTISPECIES: ferric reductase-like transmembrane domain-containing protein [unclassified Streptomyces]MBM7087343.1 cytochrome b/b6 domain-containing protein [Streptomyces sp. S12]NEA85701.1 cytochrome b/b6 domain-containing protein [Streptomyces sp. SID14436]NEC26021.1 cytochrome b/b6 domain-containing protein [Streptomyces sp. SID8111]NED17459.1 cytochrome b/b6 domain-containing protein [Streptomyces sp. SID9913]
MNPHDSTADDWLAEFLSFGVGVLSLVCLSCSVIWGLVAQDRILLGPRQRILAQAVHRTTAVASIVFLLVHIGIKIGQDHVSWIAAVIPFGLALTDDEAVMGRSFLIGLGTLAGFLMIFVGITGILRNRFATPAPVAARWRAMHMLAYPAWCAALVHGLYAGRAAKPVFLILYGLSVLGVMTALVLRASPRPVKRKIADRLSGLVAGLDQQSGRDRLEESRSRTAENALAGFENPRESRPRGATPPAFSGTSGPSAPLYETAERPAPEPASGFAAAYRAVSAPAAPQQPFAADQTARMELPPDLQPTEAVPRVDGVSSTSGNWPIPSPPPVGEAPPSAYDPLQDTGYNIPTYDNSPAAPYGSRDVYDTGETNGLYGTYNPDDTYNSGPATETRPGASPSSTYDFDAPGSGEPWNTPSGGFK